MKWKLFICINLSNSLRFLLKGGSPISKHESSAGECDSDEKNPDVIPQPVDGDEASEYLRKRQHISTIETSPSRNLLHQASNSAYMGYCTLRNGLPLHEMSAQSKMVRITRRLILWAQYIYHTKTEKYYKRDVITNCFFVTEDI